MTWFEDNRERIYRKYEDSVMINEVQNYISGKNMMRKTFAHFFDEVIYKSRGARGNMTPHDAMQDDEIIKRILEFTKLKSNFYSGDEPRLVKTFFRNAGKIAQKVANFPIKQATEIYKKYTKVGDTIYDPSCGFGSRMSACILNGRNYIGTDPYIELCKKLDECAEFYKKHFDIGDWKIYQHGSEITENIKTDFIFTSPPYFDLELYGNDDGQSVIKFPDYDEWLKGYVKPTVINCKNYLKDNGYIVINCKSNKKHRLFEDWEDIMLEHFTFVEYTDIKTTHSGKVERDYKGKHYTGANTDFGFKEKAMVFIKQ